MKHKRNSKARAKRHTGAPPIAVERIFEIIQKPGRVPPEESKTFTAMETGQPDRELIPDIHNPQAVQGGLGPLNQEGEGNRQNDELAELEQIEPDLFREPKE